MNRILSTVAILAAGIAAPALGQNQDVSPETYMDGKFCSANYSPETSGDAAAAEETDARYDSEFAEMDTDGDGMVSQAEYIACRKAAAES